MQRQPIISYFFMHCIECKHYLDLIENFKYKVAESMKLSIENVISNYDLSATVCKKIG